MEKIQVGQNLSGGYGWVFVEFRASRTEQEDAQLSVAHVQFLVVNIAPRWILKTQIRITNTNS